MESPRRTVIEPIASKAALFGHPIHPMLIHFPVAALIGLVATDAAYVATADAFWSRAGLWLSGVGAIGGWIASLAGLVDLLLVRRVRGLITAWVHAVMAVMMLSIATLNWRLRVIGEAGEYVVPWGLSLSVATALFIALAAYFGGRLVYEEAVGVQAE